MEVLCRQFVYIGTEFSSQAELFEFAAEQLTDCGRAKNPEILVKGFFDREQEFSTYLENGIAIPHCRSQSIEHATVMVIKNSTPVKWNEQGDMADLLILLAVPGENANEQHLRILARIAQSIMDEPFVERLRSLDDPQEICDCMKIINDM